MSNIYNVTSIKHTEEEYALETNEMRSKFIKLQEYVAAQPPPNANANAQESTYMYERIGNVLWFGLVWFFRFWLRHCPSLVSAAAIC